MVSTIILLCILGVSFGIALAKHGEPQPKYNVWVTLISIIIQLILYYYAGLFNNL